jgi:hypothetical protein
MLTRWLPRLAVLALTLAPLPARAADGGKVHPVTLVRVRSLDAVFQDAKYIATLAGEEERAKQVEGIIKARVGDKGLDGIDPKRPLGFYTRDLVDLSPVLMIPVADEKALVKLLQGFNLTVEKKKEGYYRIPLDFLPIERTVHVRFANGYAYATGDSLTAIDKDQLLNPERLKGANPTALASLTLRLDAVSDQYKQIALSSLEKQTNRLKRQHPPRETAAQKQVREKLLDQLAATGALIIKDGSELTAQVDVDRAKAGLALQLTFSGKSGSELRQKIAALGNQTSLFAGVAGSGTAARVLVHFTLPDNVREALGPLVDNAVKELPQKERDPTKREMIERTLKALAPSVKAGELDALVGLRGPSANGRYTLLTGLKLRDTAEIQKVVRDIVAKVAPHVEQVKIKFDAAKAGDVAIHRIDVREGLEKKFVKAFGDGPFYVAFRKDALLLTAGDQALTAIKELAAARPQAGPVFGLDASLARVVPLATTLEKRRDSQAAAAAAKEIFGEGSKDSGRLRVRIQGGEALTVRLSVSAGVVKLLARIARERRRARGEDE